MKLFTLGLLAITAAAAQTIPACINDNNQAPTLVLVGAKSIASRTFATAGVNIEWHSTSSKACQQRGAIILDFASNTPPAEHPGALAYAKVYEAVHIVVLYDRIEEKSGGPTELANCLGNVMTHEMTHILEGIARHSETGLMKANWTSRDLMQMKKGPLPLAQDDIELIQLGLHGRLGM